MAGDGQHRIQGYLSHLFGYAMALSRDREDARDLVQECALKAIEAKRVPVDARAYRSWLFTILRNGFIDRIRRQAVRTDAPPAAEPSVGADVWRHEEILINALAVKTGFARLAADHREIIGLVDIGGLSYAEAADVLGVPVGTVMSRLSRARETLLAIVGESNLRNMATERRKRAQ